VVLQIAGRFRSLLHGTVSYRTGKIDVKWTDSALFAEIAFYDNLLIMEIVFYDHLLIIYVDCIL